MFHDQAKIIQHTHTHTKAFKTLAWELVLFASLGLGVWLGINQLMSVADPTKEKKKERNMQPELRARLQKNGYSAEMSDYEATMLQHITFPSEIDVNLDDIGGCELIKEAMEEIFILPFEKPEFFRGSLLCPPKGLLFYGSPGTGKTMMAKAICKTTGCTFFNIRISTIKSKWFGDSVKLINGLFTLAHKLQPSVIFLDEIDAFLHERSAGRDGDASLAMKAEFMSLWDGLISDKKSRVIVLGATNRPADIDKAILRRLPRQFEFKMPDQKAREQILAKILKESHLDELGEYDERPVSAAILAKLTAGYSGSDLLEMCKASALIPMKEYIRAKVQRKKGVQTNSSDAKSLRSLTYSDFVEAMHRVRPTGHSAKRYEHRRVARELFEDANINSRDDSKGNPYDEDSD
uniref:AAA+ ATPase domain-containing protein n=1 Tax=Lotharella globosa TaxID=91324 RepID=A0A7S3YUU7_9EUKA|mmetsp:Transcript_28629/g.55674  ORF Transcript_28629/g.55674 Transcript_28629/m.55674 type:complete len:406 (+) Transcript_28629:111-1328(+)